MELSYSASQARRLDRDMFICTLFAPAVAREALFTLLAFNQEIARVKDAVRDPLLGEIRLQWWCDSLEQVFAGGELGPGGSQILASLAPAIIYYGLEQRHFETLILARIGDLHVQQPRGEAELLDYARASSTGLQALFIQVLGHGLEDTSQTQRQAAEGAAEDVGIGWALTGLLRAGHIPDPDDAKSVADRARTHLAKAREISGQVPKAFHCALYPAILADGYLANLERAGYCSDDPRLEKSRMGRQLRLWISARRGVY